jgi:18S rRNA (guanine1575-N7)-methyltransferase
LNNDYNFNVKINRPEEQFKDISDYFRGDVLNKYANSKSVMKIQERITIRALEILNLEKKNNILILDAGCGPGFTSFYLKEIGYNVVTLDIIYDFLKCYDIKDLNPITADMCFSPFKPCSFDAIISISALQWIFTDVYNISMRNKVINLFGTFEKILKSNSKMVFQFYPKTDEIMKEIGKIIADNTSLDGNFIIDNPDSPKKRKIFLFLKKN